MPKPISKDFQSLLLRIGRHVASSRDQRIIDLLLDAVGEKWDRQADSMSFSEKIELLSEPLNRLQESARARARQVVEESRNKLGGTDAELLTAEGRTINLIRQPTWILLDEPQQEDVFSIADDLKKTVLTSAERRLNQMLWETPFPASEEGQNKPAPYPVSDKSYLRPVQKIPIEPLTESSDMEFRISGVNSDNSIKRLAHLNGVPIETIERNARPGAASMAGFLGKSEGLKNVLIQDNKTVNSHGLTHRDLANPLFFIMNVHARLQKIVVPIFIYKGRHYSSRATSWMGSQESIFDDGLSSSVDFEVKDLQTGKELAFSGLVPHAIVRYGFYEGQTPYRLDPQKIMEVFSLSPKFALPSRKP